MDIRTQEREKSDVLEWQGDTGASVQVTASLCEQQVLFIPATKDGRAKGTWENETALFQLFLFFP